MRRSTMVAAVFLALSSSAVPAMAQVCEGAPSLQGSRNVNIDMGAAFFDGGKTYGAGFEAGSQALFGAGFGYTDYDNSSLALKSVTAEGAWEVQKKSGFAICPVAQVSRAWGLQVVGVDFTAWSLSPGLSAGYETQVSDAVSVIPNASAFFVYERDKADAGIGGEATSSETYGVLGASLALVFNDVLGVGPSVDVPVGLEGGNTQFGVTAVVGVGH